MEDDRPHSGDILKTDILRTYMQSPTLAQGSLSGAVRIVPAQN
jgi:hypothetical protein